jgi:hypothetical protein
MRLLVEYAGVIFRNGILLIAFYVFAFLAFWKAVVWLF